MTDNEAIESQAKADEGNIDEYEKERQDALKLAEAEAKRKSQEKTTSTEQTVWYTQKMMDYFKNPRNLGYIANADAVGRAGNPACGDVMELYLKVSPKGIIEDIKFRTFGCAAAIATSSMLTILAKGKTIDDAVKISRKDIADALDGLPPIKMHCSVLATEALADAVKKYKEKKQAEA